MRACAASRGYPGNQPTKRCHGDGHRPAAWLCDYWVSRQKNTRRGTTLYSSQTHSRKTLRHCWRAEHLLKVLEGRWRKKRHNKHADNAEERTVALTFANANLGIDIWERSGELSSFQKWHTKHHIHITQQCSIAHNNNNSNDNDKL